MTNTLNPANLDFLISTNLSSKSLDFKETLGIDEFLDQNFKAKTGRPVKLNFSDLIQCLDFKRKYACDTWIGLYRCLLDKSKIGEVKFSLPDYSNFLKSIKRLIFYLFYLIYYQTKINKETFFKKQFRIAFVDSTPVSVCKVIRSRRHKSMQDYAEYSKSTTGWFYGLKLHITCDFETRDVIDFMFSKAKLDDRKYLEKNMRHNFFNSKTMFVADKGYQAQWLEDLAKETGNYLLTGKKKSKNMKTLASWFDIYLLHIRARIESVFSNLKLNCFLSSTRSKSVLGYFFNYVSSLYFLLFKQSFAI